MSSRKFTLSTLALALSVVLASCSGGASSGTNTGTNSSAINSSTHSQPASSHNTNLTDSTVNHNTNNTNNDKQAASSSFNAANANANASGSGSANSSLDSNNANQSNPSTAEETPTNSDSRNSSADSTSTTAHGSNDHTVNHKDSQDNNSAADILDQPYAHSLPITIAGSTASIPLPTSYHHNYTDIQSVNTNDNDIADRNISIQFPGQVTNKVVTTAQAEASFTGQTGYQDLARAWWLDSDFDLISGGRSQAVNSGTLNSAALVLPKYAIGLAPLFSLDKKINPTTINHYDTTQAKTLTTRTSDEDKYSGKGLTVGVVTNTYQPTVPDSSQIFNHPIKTVSLDTTTSLAYQQQSLTSSGLSTTNANGFVVGAAIAGKRTSQANGLVLDAQVYVSTVSPATVHKPEFALDTYRKLYQQAHPVAIVSDFVNVDINTNDRFDEDFEDKGNKISAKVVKAVEQITANPKITDVPLFIFTTGDYSPKRYIDHTKLAVTDQNLKRINLEDNYNPSFISNVFSQDTVAPYSLVVGGTYFDPKNILTGAKQKFKHDTLLKSAAMESEVTNAAQRNFSSEQAVTEVTTKFNGQDISTKPLAEHTIDNHTNFVQTLGSYACSYNALHCLVAPVNYSSGLINRNHTDVNAKAETKTIADAAFPVTDADQRFKHTEFGSVYAAAQVAAAAVILKQQFPWFSAPNLKTTLLTTATPIGANRISYEFGWGVLNVGNALKGPTQFAFGDFIANFTNKSHQDYTALTAYNQAHHTTSDYYYTSYFTNNISGKGGLYLYGSQYDTLHLQGLNSYTGNTYVLGGNLIIGKDHIENTKAGLLNSKVFVAKNAALQALNATLGADLVIDGVASFNNSTLSCSIKGQGAITINGGSVGRNLDSTHSKNCEQTTAYTGSKATELASHSPVIKIGSTYAESLNLNNTEVFGNVVAKVKTVNVSHGRVHGSISSNVSDLAGTSTTDVNLHDAIVTHGLDVSGKVEIVDSKVGVGFLTEDTNKIYVNTTLHSDAFISNSAFHRLTLAPSSTFYFDPSANVSIVNSDLNLNGTIKVAPTYKLAKKDFVPQTGKVYPIFRAVSVSGQFNNSVLDSNTPLVSYTVHTKDLGNTEKLNKQVEVTATTKTASAAAISTASGVSVVDSSLITASSPLIDSLISSANTAYTNHNRGLALSSSAANTLTLASDLQAFNADQLRTFLVKASAPIYSDLITANSVTLSDAYLDFSRKVNANYFSSLDNRKVKAYVSYSFLNNKFDTEFDQNANTNSVAGAHSYSTNLKATQLSNSVSAGAYGQFGYYNVGIGANYLHNDWKEKYADYEQVVANQQDLLMNLGQAKVDTATLMLSLAKTTGNYFLGTSIFGSYQRYNVDRSSLATLDQNSKFNSYGVTVNFNTGFRHFISTNSGFSGQASIAYNYNYHDKFSEQANSDLAKVLSYDIKAQGTSLAYANFLGQYFYNFSGFGFNQRLNLELGYTLNLFSTANQQTTNSVTGVSLSSSNAFTGSNSNLLKFAAGYRVSLIKDLDLDLGVSYYTNNYWRVVKGTATLTYSF